MGDVINLWHVESYRRLKAQQREREPRFRPVNECCGHPFRCMRAEPGCPHAVYCATDAARELTSDNIRLTTIRPWRPEDDDGGSAA